MIISNADMGFLVQGWVASARATLGHLVRGEGGTWIAWWRGTQLVIPPCALTDLGYLLQANPDTDLGLVVALWRETL